MVDILWTTFLNAFLMETCDFQIKFDWNVFLDV